MIWIMFTRLRCYLDALVVVFSAVYLPILLVNYYMFFIYFLILETYLFSTETEIFRVISTLQISISPRKSTGWDRHLFYITDCSQKNLFSISMTCEMSFEMKNNKWIKVDAYNFEV